MSGVTKAVRRTVLSVVRRSPVPTTQLPEAVSILAAMPVAVVVLSEENRFTYANPAAEQFLGLSFPQLAQLSLDDVLPEDSPLFLMVGQLRTGATSIADHDLSFDGPRLSKKGISVQGTTLSEDPGSVLLILQDGNTVRSLDRQIAARNAARSITGMAAILAHEIKNPLSGIRGAAQLLESSVAETDQELTVLIREEADRIRALVDRMEVFGEKPVAMEAVNIHRVLEHVRRVARSGFGDGLRFSESYDPSLPSVWGNRDQLVQVLLNLVKNAADALIAGGALESEITLITRYQHGLRLANPTSDSDNRVELPLLVVVRDNGPGIPEDIRPHLFEPFVSSKPSGQGLGLALVAKIIADHGGLIEVESRPGRTEFRLHLPMLAEEDAQ
ncbi:PAS domain-containing protein [Acidisoma cellulosilytica]|uniref:histidine kinase n=1 Tax=Acidisoma cellulosilyticum TaxID=2802395 RepID=A0A964E1Z5_9PROT|nr:ATP-binding protein [Acidisoma cellulosilyticum]MCB8879060.1 PAS domain-containing protein [Acidisoma cellulosilyticum]